MSKELIEVTTAELSKVEDISLTTNQLEFMFKKTPPNHVYTRPAKGGGKWSFVTGTYIKKVLNLMFGWDWDFEVIEYKYDLTIKQVFVLGKLRCRSNGKEIVKMQFGRKDIICKKGTDTPLDLGNDLKAATTDALKKCANELGIAADVYSPNEFKEIKVVKEKTPRTLMQATEANFSELVKMLKANKTINQLKEYYLIDGQTELNLIAAAKS